MVQVKNSQELVFSLLSVDPERGALYSAPQGDGLWTGFYLPNSVSFPNAMNLEESWSFRGDESRTGGCYLFSNDPPEEPEGLLTFLAEQVEKMQSCEGHRTNRWILWLDLQDQERPVLSCSLGFTHSRRSKKGIVPCETTFSSGMLVLEISGWSPVASLVMDTDAGCLVLKPGRDGRIKMDYKDQRLYRELKEIRILLTGQSLGALRTVAQAKVSRLGLTMEDTGGLIRTGIRFDYRVRSRNALQTLHFPVFGSRISHEEKPFEFEIHLNPLYPTGRILTEFRFLKADRNSQLQSAFRTDFGYKVTLSPLQEESSFAMQGQGYNGTYFVPCGPYRLDMEHPEDCSTQNLRMMCGLSGTETISFVPGDVMVFHPGMPAYAPLFPVPEPADSPFITLSVPDLPRLNAKTTTAWVTVVGISSGTPVYVSQPAEATMYAKGKGIHDASKWPLALGYDPIRAGVLEREQYPFPMAPYAYGPECLVEDCEDKEDVPLLFERQVLLQTRKKHISKGQRFLLQDFVPGSAVRKTTTPQGMLLDVDEEENWCKLLLARTCDPTADPCKKELYLESVFGKLREALQNSKLFLVITKALQPEHVGKFHNKTSIAGWPFELRTGEKQQYGNYSNVLIFKFGKGAVSELVKHPEQWTNGPHLNETENEELYAVSAWLQHYIESSPEKDEFFRHFHEVVSDENWNGILSLNCDLELGAFPSELKGLLAGMDTHGFRAHHLGVNVNYVAEKKGGTDDNGGIDVQEDSSLFGLINYIDPVYKQRGMNHKAVPVFGQDDFDFKVLALRVLFLNSEIKNFHCLLQLTVNRLLEQHVNCVTSLNDPATHNDDQTCEPTIKSILFHGHCEIRGGIPTYRFYTPAVNSLEFIRGNMLFRADIIQASFSSWVQPDSQLVHARFLLEGHIHCTKIEGVDLLSYGSVEGESGSYISFSNLSLGLTHDVSREIRSPMTLDCDALQLKLNECKPRPGSLCHGFPLKLKRLLCGTEGSRSLERMGYLPILLRWEQAIPATAPKLLSVQEGWAGLEFELDLGSGGMLAENTDFTSTFIIAWSATEGPVHARIPRYPIYLGIRLPGGGEKSKQFRLQDVLQLSIDDVHLVCNAKAQLPTYRLELMNLGIQYLNFQFPPRGSTNVALFGNPKAEESTTEIGWYAAYAKDNETECREGF